MGVMSKKKAPQEKVEEKTLVPLSVVQVPRAWIHANGWPDRFEEVESLVGVEDGFVARTEPRGQLAMDSYRHDLNIAYLRKGPTGQACLYVQAWVGAA